MVLACEASLDRPRALQSQVQPLARDALGIQGSQREEGRTLSITTGWFVRTSSNSVAIPNYAYPSLSSEFGTLGVRLSETSQ